MQSSVKPGESKAWGKHTKRKCNAAIGPSAYVAYERLQHKFRWTSLWSRNASQQSSYYQRPADDMKYPANDLDGPNEFASPNVGQDRKDEGCPHHQGRVPALRDVVWIIEANNPLNLAAGEVRRKRCRGQPGEKSDPS